MCLFLVHYVDDSVMESSEEEERLEQQPHMREHCVELINRAAVHLRRAMVLYIRADKYTMFKLHDSPVY